MTGSWIRFAVGLLLAAEIIRQLVTGDNNLIIAGILSIVYIGLGIVYFAIRF